MLQPHAFAFLLALQAAAGAGGAAPPEPESPGKEIVVTAERQNKRWLEGLEAFRAGRYAEAEEKLRVLEQRVESVARFEALLLSGFSSDFVFTIDRIPNEGAAIVYLRGVAQARQGKLNIAAGAMKEALRIDSKFYDAYVDLALIEVLRGRPHAARRHLKPMAKLLKKCDYNCEEKQARYNRVQEVVSAGGEAQNTLEAG